MFSCSTRSTVAGNLFAQEQFGVIHFPQTSKTLFQKLTLLTGTQQLLSIMSESVADGSVSPAVAVCLAKSSS